jgi:hypothetical protein
VQHLVAVVKQFLRAVAVMNVPINNHHSLQIVHGKRVRCCHSNIVKKAEPLSIVPTGVVARRSN